MKLNPCFSSLFLSNTEITKLKIKLDHTYFCFFCFILVSVGAFLGSCIYTFGSLDFCQCNLLLILPNPTQFVWACANTAGLFFFLKMLQLYVVVAAHWSPDSSSTKAAKCFCPQIQWRLKPFTKTFEDSVDRWTPNMPWTWKFIHSWAQVKLISTYWLWSLTHNTFLLLDGFQGRTVSYGWRFFHFNLWLKCRNLLLLGYTLKSKKQVCCNLWYRPRKWVK